MLSNRPSTFDRSESKSNGAARPWSTLLDLLLQWTRMQKTLINWLQFHSQYRNMNHVTARISFLSANAEQFITFRDCQQHSISLWRAACKCLNTFHVLMRLNFKLCNLRRLLTLNRRGHEPPRLIWTVSEKRETRKRSFLAISAHVYWPSGGN